MPSILEIKVFFLNRAKVELTTAIEKLNEATAPALPYRLFRAAEARAAYTKYLEYIQVTGGDSDLLADKIKAILPAFDATGTTHNDLLAAYNLIEHYAPMHDLESLVNLALRDFSNTLLYPLFEIAFTRIQAAVRTMILQAIQAIVPSFTGKDEQGNDLSLETLWTAIPFKYNRAEAANRATNLSKNNFRAYSAGGFPQLYSDVPAVVGKIERPNSRDYTASLDHTPNATGSSIFISECIFAGRIPMTVRPNTESSETNCSADDLNNYVDGFNANGWRNCVSQQSATQTWKNHLGIIAYFTTGLQGNHIGIITRDDIQNVVYQTPDDPSFDAGNLKTDRPEYPAARDALLAKLNTTPLNTLMAGDYIYANIEGGDNHGFMMIGWGPLLGTLAAIEFALVNSLSPARASINQEHVIPYVADFCFGTKASVTSPRDSENPDDRTGWLQDPRARPFYSTRVLITGEENLRPDQITNLRTIHYGSGNPLVVAYQEFSLNQWDFYKIPDVAVIPFRRLYLPL